MIAPIEKLKSLLNNDIISLLGNDLINDSYIQSYKAVCFLMTDDACLNALFSSDLDATKYQTNHTTDTDTDCVYSSSNWTEERRILSAERKNDLGDSSDNVFYKCTRVSSQKGESALIKNENSIYYENDKWNPKYFYNTNGGLNIVPKNIVISPKEPRGRVFWLTYPTFESSLHVSNFVFTFDLGGMNFSSITKAQESILFYGLPIETKELVYIEMALSLIQVYMADFVHDEEDTELVALIKEQASSLLAKKNMELNVILPKYGNIKEK